MEDALDQLLNELRCSICLDSLTEAVMLPCSHRFCRDCVENVKSCACPLCKQAFTKRQILRDQLVDRLADRATALRCAAEQAAASSSSPAKRQKRARTEEEMRLDALRAEFNRREEARMGGSDDGVFEEAVVLLCTGLDDEMQALAETLARQHRSSKIVEEWSVDVTHTVCGTDQEGRARRTLKYLCGVVSGGRVLSPSFLSAWRERGLPPLLVERHLAAGDPARPGGPQRALQHGSPLLQGLTVLLFEPLDTSRECLIAVLEAAGARRVKGSPDVVLCARPPPLDQLPHPASLWLHPSWLLDSAAAFCDLDKNEYGAIVVPEEEDEEEQAAQEQEHQDDSDDMKFSEISD